MMVNTHCLDTMDSWSEKMIVPALRTTPNPSAVQEMVEPLELAVLLSDLTV